MGLGLLYTSPHNVVPNLLPICFFLSKGCPSSYRNKLLSIYLLAALRFVNTSIAILFLVIYTSGLLSKSAVFIPDFRSHSKMYAEKNWEKKVGMK